MNFCLTDIQTSIDSGTGFEYEMPGSHSDIGGGCKDPVVERLVDYRKLVDKLISEGWYTEEQKETVPGRYSPSPVGGMPVYNPAYCKARRTVSNAYQYIPMEIMVNFAKKYGKMAFDESELKKHTAKIPDDLQPYRKALVADAGAQDGAHHRKADLKGLDVKKLRNKYLHLTASREGGGSGIIDWLVNRGRYPGRGIIKG
jgi:hypothetical protein